MTKSLVFENKKYLKRDKTGKSAAYDQRFSESNMQQNFLKS